MRTDLDALDVRKLNVVALCSIVRAISSCLGNKAVQGPAFLFAALGGTELSSRADSEGVKPRCVAVNPSLSWPLCTRGFLYIFQMNFGGTVSHGGLGFDKGVLYPSHIQTGQLKYSIILQFT